jgi:hypothetical protein
MGSHHVESFASCINLCASLTGCQGVSFTKDDGDTGAGWCYPKSEYDLPLYPVEGVWGAKVIVPITCPNPESYTYTGPSGGLFKLECGIDHPGADIGLSYIDTFNECIGTYCFHRMTAPKVHPERNNRGKLPLMPEVSLTPKFRRLRCYLWLRRRVLHPRQPLR